MINRGEYKSVVHCASLDLFKQQVTRRAKEMDIKPTALLRRLERKSGVTYSCLKSWYDGKTKRPQLVTIEFVLKHLDMELMVRYKSTGVVIPFKRWAA